MNMWHENIQIMHIDSMTALYLVILKAYDTEAHTEYTEVTGQSV